MILVAGGTGQLGSTLVRRLTERGTSVRVLTRAPGRASHLAGPLVDIVSGDVRDPESLAAAVAGADTVVSAIHGFSGKNDVSPRTVDRDGNINLVNAAAGAGAAFVLMSIVGAAPDSRIGLFRAKHAAEQYLRQSGVPWTIVRATAFVETWATVLGAPLLAKNQTTVFGRGDNPINFVSAGDVASLVALAVVDPALRGRVIEIGSDNVSFNQLAAMLQHAAGRPGPVRHIPRAMLRAIATLLPPFNPGFAAHARAAVVMDTCDMTFDAGPTRRAFPSVPRTPLAEVLERYVAAHQPAAR
ncbi:MAG: SDR family oxidoreductase [Acidobacteriota bacterium]